MEAFKNVFNEKFVNKLATLIKTYDESFKKDTYVKTIMQALEELELKHRMRLISSEIKNHTDLPYIKILEVLKKSKAHFSKEENIGLTTLVFPDFVEVYGLNDFDISMQALEFFTINSSSEFAVRHFLIKDEKKALEYFYKWSKSENEHIKRLASEGSRPRLPWGISLPSFKKDPSFILPILEELKNDESLYVRRSVANNLNDVAKDNEDIVREFIKVNIGKSKNCDWLLKHGARTLLKKGDIKTLDFFGFRKIQDLEISDFILDKKVNIGEYLNFSFSLTSSEKFGSLRVEYEIDFLMANEKRSKKVFMISSSINKNSTKDINKRHNFKKITTRKYYQGIHYLSLIINGEKVVRKSFTLS